MTLTKISPLGKREGLGTFDTFFDTEKHIGIQEAISSNDVFVVDFVRDDQDIIYFKAYHISRPDYTKTHMLSYQRFPFGVDVSDDSASMRICDEIKQELGL